jgi:hypothetical protein
MEGSTPADESQATDRRYNEAVIRALDAAKLKAADIDREQHTSIDHASQAALEASGVTGRAFDRAYDEVFPTTWYAVRSDAPAEDVLNRVHRELLRVRYGH